MPSRFRIRVAVQHLRKGGIIGYPTEGVFGLGCNPNNGHAVARLLKLKGRTAGKGLILIAADFEQVETLALNESTFWSGAPDSTQNNPAGREHLPAMRRLLFAGEYRQAVDLISRHLLGRRGNYGSHLPVGDLLLEMHHDGGEVHGYRRELDLDQAAATVTYSIGGLRFTPGGQDLRRDR